VGTNPSKWQMLCYVICPCAMIGCGGRWRCCGRNRPQSSPVQARRAWKRLVLSFAGLMTLIQFALLTYGIWSKGGLDSFRDNPLLGPHAHTLDMMGAKNAAKVLYRDEWWRLLSTLLLHGGLVHFSLNALIQLRMGLWLEVLWGHGVWSMIYFSSGAYSSLVSCVFLPDTLSVGASGAICGVIGAGLVFLLTTWNQTMPSDILERNANAFTLAFNIIGTACLSIVPNMDYAAHLGGFLSGMVLAMGIFANKMGERTRKVQWLLKVTGGVLWVGLVLATQAYFWKYGQPSRELLDICQPPDC